MGIMKNKDMEFLWWMKGAMELYEDLPDGAWWAVGEETVELFNKEHGTDWDPHEGFHYYCKLARDL